jgi:hypothetical protein
MLQIFSKPLPIALTLLTVLGVLMHDTQLDKATTVAIALPAVLASYGVADAVARSSEHVHVERVSITAQQPRVQPRNSDDKKYMTQKRLSANLLGSEYSWPSV